MNKQESRQLRELALKINHYMADTNLNKVIIETAKQRGHTKETILLIQAYDKTLTILQNILKEIVKIQYGTLITTDEYLNLCIHQGGIKTDCQTI